MQPLEVKAIARGIRISPRKVGEVASLVKRRTAQDAITILEHTHRKSAEPVTKAIKSAMANARHNHKLSPEDIKGLEVKTIMVTEGGLKLRRYKFVGSGRRARPRPMVKRSSHLTVILTAPAKAEKTPAKPAATKPAVKTASPAKAPAAKKPVAKKPTSKAPKKEIKK